MNIELKRILFLLSWLIVIAPIYFFYQELNPIEKTNKDRVVFKGIFDARQLTLIEIHEELANYDSKNELIKTYQLTIKEGGYETLKAVFLSPAHKNTVDFNDVCSGGPSVYSCHLTFNTSQKEEGVWLRLKKWNNDISQLRVH